MCLHAEALYRNSGRRTRIRTLDPLLPKQVRYQAALHADSLYSNRIKGFYFPRSNIFPILFGVYTIVHDPIHQHFALARAW